MPEQSHLDAMREAVRGDIERAKQRRASIFERPAAPPFEIRAAPASDPVQDEPHHAPEPEVRPEPEPVTAAAPAQKPQPRWKFWRR